MTFEQSLPFSECSPDGDRTSTAMGRSCPSPTLHPAEQPGGGLFANWSLEHLLGGMIRCGRLTITIGNSRAFTVGEVRPEAPHLDAAIHVRESATAAAIAVDPELQLGEAYTDGRLTVTEGTLWDVLDIIGRNIVHRPPAPRMTRLRRKLGTWLAARNDPDRSRRNVAHHYDLPEDLYRLFLDPDMQYSCAYFTHPHATLEEAQQTKKAHIAAKLALSDGQRVLDIGCGWGGMALSLAQAAHVEVLGITLSVEQLRVAQARARDAGLEERVRFELIDYRKLGGTFDRIVSVGMFEHVGLAHYDDYFGALSHLLTPQGVGLVHTIGRKDPGPGVNPWMIRHIFPGGFVPAISQATAAIERSGLWVTDIEVLRLHYAQTLRHWRLRVEAEQATITKRMGKRFYRMWEFYLAGCEMSFRYDGLMVFQTQLTRDIAAVPLTRDYMAREEARILNLLPAIGGGSAPTSIERTDIC